jgi:peptidoglycan/xylan/chitin deacetylase (PgdA/CDA1 family)
MKRPNKRIPILMYHHILPQKELLSKYGPNYPFVVSTEQFEKQLQFLQKSNIQPINLQTLLNRNNGVDTLPEKSIVLTFDDGAKDNYEYAFPILQSAGFTASFFIVSDWIGQDGFMSGQHIKELVSAAIEIGSHTKSHIPLNGLLENELLLEIAFSKKALEKYAPINLISFPHGSYSKRAINEIHKKKYIAALSSKWGYVSSPPNTFCLPRISIKQNTQILEFSKICLPSNEYVQKKAILNRSKKLVEAVLGTHNYNRIAHLYYKRQISL